MKFREVKYVDDFIKVGLEIGAITNDQIQELMDCDINIDCFNIFSSNPKHVLSWSQSGIAGSLMQALSRKNDLIIVSNDEIKHQIEKAKDHMDKSMYIMQKILEEKELIITKLQSQLNTLKTPIV